MKKSYDNLELSAPEIRTFQKDRLSQVLRFANQYSSFYADIWRKTGVDVEGFEEVSDLKDFPIIEKEEFRSNKNRIETLIDVYTAYESTGSTGDGVIVKFDEQAADWREAITVRTELKNGYRPREKIAELGGNPQSSVGSFFRPKVSVPEDMTLEDQIELLNSEDPKHLLYGGHVLFRLCKKAKNSNIKFSPKSVINFGEILTPKMKGFIEESLDTQVMDVYETSEVGQIAWSCPEGGYHVNEDLVRLEIVDDDGEPVSKGEIGDVVVTGLVNRAYPVIRVKIGDLAVKGVNNCSCNTTFKKIQTIEGRSDNIITNKEGEKVMSRQIIDYLAGFTELEKFVFERLDESDYRLRYSPGPGFQRSNLSEIKNGLERMGIANVEMIQDSQIQRIGWKAAPVRDLRN